MYQHALEKNEYICRGLVLSLTVDRGWATSIRVTGNIFGRIPQFVLDNFQVRGEGKGREGGGEGKVKLPPSSEI